MKKLIELDTYPIIDVLDILLKDRTTGKNIIWATRSYEQLGVAYSDTFIIDKKAILSKPFLIQPRVYKPLEEQQARTKARAEVFTPSWICNKMNNSIDSEWFGYDNVFNTEKDNSWTSTTEKIVFPPGKNSEDYINEIRLEIACGEAPFLVSRYDASTGGMIPIKERIGILDRKLRIVNESKNNPKEWLTQVRNAFKSTYGYEFQGDNLLIGRINLLMTFVDYWRDKWQETPIPLRTLTGIAEIISWNLWQMDALTDCVPLGAPQTLTQQLTLWNEEEIAPLCLIKNWQISKNGETVPFALSKKESD